MLLAGAVATAERIGQSARHATASRARGHGHAIATLNSARLAVAAGAGSPHQSVGALPSGCLPRPSASRWRGARRRPSPRGIALDPSQQCSPCGATRRCMGPRAWAGNPCAWPGRQSGMGCFHSSESSRIGQRSLHVAVISGQLSRPGRVPPLPCLTNTCWSPVMAPGSPMKP
jgi:hypothetical protein